MTDKSAPAAKKPRATAAAKKPEPAPVVVKPDAVQFHRELSVGSSGGDFDAVQAAFKEMGYETGTPGRFDRVMRSAVLEWQQSRQVWTTGRINYSDWKDLFGS